MAASEGRILESITVIAACQSPVHRDRIDIDYPESPPVDLDQVAFTGLSIAQLVTETPTYRSVHDRPWQTAYLLARSPLGLAVRYPNEPCVASQ